MSCFGDADLEEESSTQRYCHNKSLINRVFSSSRWYYVLSIGFMVNFGVVVVLVSFFATACLHVRYRIYSNRFFVLRSTFVCYI